MIAPGGCMDMHLKQIDISSFINLAARGISSFINLAEATADQFK